MKRAFGSEWGFTLIELLVVVLIIGILAAIALPQYKKAVEKTKFTEYIGWVRSLYHGEKQYYLANGTWTGDFRAFAMDFPQGTTFTTSGATLPDGRTFNYNKNNDSIQFHMPDQNVASFTLYLSNGKLYCFHYNDATKKAFCKKYAKSCSTSQCLIIDYGTM